MRNIFLSMIILSLPVFTSAQQKSSTQQDQLRKEMNAKMSEMQAQIKSLQDSVTLLQKELRDRSKNESWSFGYSSPQSEQELEDFMKKNHGWNYNYHPEMPDAPLMPEAPPAQPFDFHFEMPPIPYAHPNEYHFDFPEQRELENAYKYYYETAPCPDEPRHKHSWMEGLPFYDWFNK